MVGAAAAVGLAIKLGVVHRSDKTPGPLEGLASAAFQAPGWSPGNRPCKDIGPRCFDPEALEPGDSATVGEDVEEAQELRMDPS